MPTEAQYKAKFRELLGVWTEAYEPGRGSGFGYPDIQMLVEWLGDKHLFPAELKKGELRNGILYPDEIKKTQIIWHHNFLRAGGSAAILVMFGPLAAMDVWEIPDRSREATSLWRKGYPIGECIQWVSYGKLARPLRYLCWGE